MYHVNSFDLLILVPPFTDVTALEIEVKGESVPLSVVLHPYSMHVPGKNLVGTTLKKMVTVRHSPLSSEQICVKDRRSQPME